MTDLFPTQLVYFTGPDPTSAEVKDLVSAYNEACEAVDKVEKEQFVQKKRMLDILWRHLLLIVDVPFLTGTLKEMPLLYKNISVVNYHWWDDPAASKLWDDYKKLLSCSPKLRYIVRAAKAGKKNPGGIEFTDEQGVKFKHFDKIIFAAYDPLLAFCIYVVLLQKLSTRYEGIENAKATIKPLWSSQQAPDIVSGFQRTLGECKRAGKHGIDIIILLTRVGTTDVILTKADRLIMADVDPSITRNAHLQQLQIRVARITQGRPATFVQLLSESLNIQETMLHNRELGKPTMGNVILLPGDDEFEVSGNGNGADATVDIEDDEWDIDVE